MLLWEDGSCITMKEARRELKFFSFEIYQSAIKHNVTLVEYLLQKRYQGLPLGLRRLWRWPGMGESSKDPSKSEIHKVFLTISVKEVGRQLAAGSVIIQR